MGVHTGDSITVAPAQTLTRPRYQRLRDQSNRDHGGAEIGVKTRRQTSSSRINPAK